MIKFCVGIFKTLLLPSFVILALTFGTFTYQSYAQQDSTPEKRSFDTLLSRDNEMCSQFGDVIANQIPEYIPDAIDVHPMFETFKKIDIDRRKIEQLIPEGYRGRANDTVYTAKIDIDNDGEDEQLFRSELLQGLERTSYYIIENFSVYSEPYPRMDGEAYLPNSPWFAATPTPQFRLSEWEDWMSFTDFPRNFSSLKISGDELTGAGELKSKFIKSNVQFLYNFTGLNTRTVIFKFKGRNYLASLYPNLTPDKLINSGVVLEYKDKKVTPYCIAKFSTSNS